ncbi:hypothetical protein Dimus_009963, partial [Dionaea muscipula]
MQSTGVFARGDVVAAGVHGWLVTRSVVALRRGGFRLGVCLVALVVMVVLASVVLVGVVQYAWVYDEEDKDVSALGVVSLRCHRLRCSGDGAEARIVYACVMYGAQYVGRGDQGRKTKKIQQCIWSAH